MTVTFNRLLATAGELFNMDATGLPPNKTIILIWDRPGLVTAVENGAVMTTSGSGTASRPIQTLSSAEARIWRLDIYDGDTGQPMSGQAAEIAISNPTGVISSYTLTEGNDRHTVPDTSEVNFLARALDSSGNFLNGVALALSLSFNGGPYEFLDTYVTQGGGALWTFNLVAGSYSFRVNDDGTDPNAGRLSNAWLLQVTGEDIVLPLTIEPTSQEQLREVNITSSGWQASSNVQMFIDGAQSDSIFAQAGGNINISFILNSTINVGTHQIHLQGFSSAGQPARTNDVTITVTEPTTVLNPIFEFNPRTVNPLFTVTVILEGWAPNEEVRFTTDQPPPTGNELRLTVDNAGNRTQQVQVSTYFGNGINTVTATGQVSGSIVTQTLGVGTTASDAVVIELDPPLNPFLGRNMTVSGSIMTDSLIPSAININNYTVVAEVNHMIGAQIGPLKVAGTMPVAAYNTFTGDFAFTLKIPEEGPSLNQGYEARLKLIVTTKTTPPIVAGTETIDFNTRPRPVTFHITKAETSPKNVPGNVGDTYDVTADFGAFGDPGTPAHGFAITQEWDEVENTWVDIPDSLFIHQDLKGGADLDHHYTYGPFTLTEETPLGTRIKYRVRVGSYDRTANEIISYDDQQELFMQVGARTIFQLLDDYKWWLIGGFVVGGAGILVYKATRPGPVAQLASALAGGIRGAGGRIRRSSRRSELA